MSVYLSNSYAISLRNIVAMVNENIYQISQELYTERPEY